MTPEEYAQKVTSGGRGNSLTKSDGFQNEQFDYMLSNPPYGVDWKKYGGEIDTEAKKGDTVRDFQEQPMVLCSF